MIVNRRTAFALLAALMLAAEAEQPNSVAAREQSEIRLRVLHGLLRQHIRLGVAADDLAAGAHRGQERFRALGGEDEGSAARRLLQEL